MIAAVAAPARTMMIMVTKIMRTSNNGDSNEIECDLTIIEIITMTLTVTTMILMMIIMHLVTLLNDAKKTRTHMNTVHRQIHNSVE